MSCWQSFPVNICNWLMEQDKELLSLFEVLVLIQSSMSTVWGSCSFNQWQMSFSGHNGFNELHALTLHNMIMEPGQDHFKLATNAFHSRGILSTSEAVTLRALSLPPKNIYLVSHSFVGTWGMHSFQRKIFCLWELNISIGGTNLEQIRPNAGPKKNLWTGEWNILLNGIPLGHLLPLTEISTFCKF